MGFWCCFAITVFSYFRSRVDFCVSFALLFRVCIYIIHTYTRTHALSLSAAAANFYFHNAFVWGWNVDFVLKKDITNWREEIKEVGPMDMVIDKWLLSPHNKPTPVLSPHYRDILIFRALYRQVCRWQQLCWLKRVFMGQQQHQVTMQLQRIWSK